jgi:pimeloyl-ACP methyl ester carboxylesterase
MHVSTLHSRDGTIIGYDIVGRGPKVILVDGALVYRAYRGHGRLAELLADRYTVYTYDRRGRGEGTDTQPYAVQREIEDIAAFIETAAGSAFVYGISSGGALALEAARAWMGCARAQCGPRSKR